MKCVSDRICFFDLFPSPVPLAGARIWSNRWLQLATRRCAQACLVFGKVVRFEKLIVHERNPAVQRGCLWGCFALWRLFYSHVQSCTSKNILVLLWCKRFFGQIKICEEMWRVFKVDHGDTHIYTYTCTYIYICIYVFMHIYIYIHVYIQEQDKSFSSRRCNPLPLNSWQVSYESYDGSRISWFALK